jgi:hypothetical protein
MQKPDHDIIVRRAVSLANSNASTCAGWLEDNFHHFGVTIRHENGRVVDVEVSTVRYPWTSCADAGHPMEVLVGSSLIERPEVLDSRFPMQMQCTHIFELAALTMAHALHSHEDRRFDMVVRRAPSGPDSYDCALSCNGEEQLILFIDGSQIVSPTQYEGRDLYSGFREWIAALPAEEAMRLWLMRRAAWLASGASRFTPTPVAHGTGLGPVCHTYQPENRHTAFAMPYSRRDVTDPETSILGKTMI